MKSTNKQYLDSSLVGSESKIVETGRFIIRIAVVLNGLAMYCLEFCNTCVDDSELAYKFLELSKYALNISGRAVGSDLSPNGD